ncbi:pyridoxal phosphate-dependent enzyme [Candidatus Scalindua japonica]|uniref:Pyridoxal phosphate-dependent enzyme n=1 Tax=Candidatus Scalindua japonica TaxID=1284222 RepID=A0A286U4B5_9BACT|nr:pyridoxal phosphate-dependent enzyme [Candidatus Scalindua japonica]
MNKKRLDDFANFNGEPTFNEVHHVRCRTLVITKSFRSISIIYSIDVG